MGDPARGQTKTQNPEIYQYTSNTAVLNLWFLQARIRATCFEMFFFSFCLQQSRFLGSSANITDGVSCTVHKAVHVSFTNRLQSDTLSTFAPKIFKENGQVAHTVTHILISMLLTRKILN